MEQWVEEVECDERLRGLLREQCLRLPARAALLLLRYLTGLLEGAAFCEVRRAPAGEEAV